MLIAHLVRAYRWSLMLTPIGYRVGIGRMLLAVMVGYLANLFVPRMGEITRCGVLKRTDNVPMAVSIGSVVAERIIDLLTLISIIFLALLLEYDLLSGYLKEVFTSNALSVSQNLVAIYILGGVTFTILIISYIFFRAYKNKLKRSPLFLKIRSFLRAAVEGLMSIRKIEKKKSFWASTIVMWLLYYLLTYIVVFSIEETASLSLKAGLTILAAGSIGMATPVQAGIGAFHALVSGVLISYGVDLEDGILFATILHSSQVISVIVLGGISLVATILIQRKKKNGEPGQNSKY